jgi:heme A synthase
MQSDQRFARCSIVITAILALAAGIGTLSATLGAPLGAIVLGEISGFACLVAFTLLIWAAIQDGKQPDRAAADW